MVSPINRKLRLISLIIAALLGNACFLPAFCYSQESREVRVAILQDVSSLRLKIEGPYEIIDSTNNKVLARGKGLNTTVTTYGGSILLGNVRADTNKVFIKTPYSERIIINGRIFRGNIQLIKNNMKLLVVNHIDLDDYVRGIGRLKPDEQLTLIEIISARLKKGLKRKRAKHSVMELEGLGAHIWKSYALSSWCPSVLVITAEHSFSNWGKTGKHSPLVLSNLVC